MNLKAAIIGRVFNAPLRSLGEVPDVAYSVYWGTRNHSEEALWALLTAL